MGARAERMLAARSSQGLEPPGTPGRFRLHLLLTSSASALFGSRRPRPSKSIMGGRRFSHFFWHGSRAIRPRRRRHSALWGELSDFQRCVLWVLRDVREATSDAVSRRPRHTQRLRAVLHAAHGVGVWPVVENEAGPVGHLYLRHRRLVHHSVGGHESVEIQDVGGDRVDLVRRQAEGLVHRHCAPDVVEQDRRVWVHAPPGSARAYLS
jgi:hypothetical protein